MKISSNGQYQRANIAHGFDDREFSTVEDLKFIACYDWSPSLFLPLTEESTTWIDNEAKKGTDSYKNLAPALGSRYRNSTHWKCSEFLFGDIDNADKDSKCTLEQFREIFDKYEYWIITSRSHQKQKKKEGPRDRYHVIFPQGEICKDREKLNYDMACLVEEFPFIDNNAKNAERFFFGCADPIVEHHEGEFLRPKPKVEPIRIEKKIVLAHDHYQGNDKKTLIMSALTKAYSQGVFDEYAEWVRVGMALKAGGYSLGDWLNVTHAHTPRHLSDSKWQSFDPKRITEATLLHFARIVEPDLFVRRQAIAGPVAAAKEIIIPVKGATNLDETPSQEMIEAIKEIIFRDTGELDKDGNPKPLALVSDWYYRIIELDPVIKNCIKWDYTTGGVVTNYPNSDMLCDAIIKRLQNYILVPSITDLAVQRIKNRVSSENRTYNNVLTYIDTIIAEHGDAGPSVLDQVLAMMDFDVPDWDSVPLQHVKDQYREILDKFFLRMHCHLEGTRLRDDGLSYCHLMENDIVPVLQGGQNKGKTTLCRWLAGSPDFYVELGSGSANKFGTADTVRKVRGMILAELGEMKIMKTDEDVETIKSFISQKVYAHEQKYQEFSKPIPATVSYIGTSNMKEFLSDTTGNRRFYPIAIKDINLNAILSNKKLPEKLHAHYALRARGIPTDERFQACMMDSLVGGFMEKERETSMIRHSDYGAIVEIVAADFESKKGEANARNRYHTVTPHWIDRQLKVGDYSTRPANKNSVAQAMQYMGYTKGLVSINAQKVPGWKKLYDDNSKE
jgi:hypothetical protein